MWQQQGKIVDKLVELIQMLQLRRETGQLTARHGNASAAEEGIIVFVSGKVTEARVGRRSGSEALNKLTGWENCLCWFVPAMEVATRPHASVPLNEGPEKFMLANPPPPVLSHTSGEAHKENSWTPDPHPEAPYRVSPLQSALIKIERLGLSRAHRHLFLLIDGKRPVSDLIRLIGREEDEVYLLLQDLEQAVLIRIPGEYHRKRS
jgi:hypothetical protein